jgi:putative multiple sugar transport system ATP-binding protein
MLVSSSELPELLTLCDRIYAMYKGRVVAEFSRDVATEEGLARAISGVALEWSADAQARQVVKS